MPRRVRLPMFALAAGLLALIVLLATLQYRWLGQISEAERSRMGATLRASASAFAEDFDRELNRAYLLFEMPPSPIGEGAAELAARVDRWQATSRFPRVIKDVYVATPGKDGISLARFDQTTRTLEAASWPAALEPVRAQLAAPDTRVADEAQTFVVHAPVQAVWPDVPALVTTAPRFVVESGTKRPAGVSLPAPMAATVLWLDADYVRRELLPALAQQHFQASGGLAYEVAVVPASGQGSIYHSSDAFDPQAEVAADAAADLFHLRVQDFGPLAAEISRFAFFSTAPGRGTVTWNRYTTTAPPARGGEVVARGEKMSIIVQQTDRAGGNTTIADHLVATGTAATAARLAASSSAHWRLLVKHPSGSLEQAVGSARRRNLAVSTGILGILAISVGFLIVSTRRAHDLARQQLEFVATVSHELRTPLAVIRSAADNLADGVIDDRARVRQYGQLLRGEGLRLSELVEQILEFAGLQAGRSAAARQPVAIDRLVRDAVAAAEGSVSAAGLRLDVDVDEDLPLVAGDHAALRRVLLNLIGNAVKYGAAGGWVGVRARAERGVVAIAVSDRGAGIAASEQEKIFAPFYRSPDAVAAQIQGAGLGLSLVKRIVEAHGGRVALTSAPGQGSTFTVTLPALSGEPAASEDGVGDAAPLHP